MTIVKTTQKKPNYSNWRDIFSHELNDWKRNNYSSTQTTLPRVNIGENDESFWVELAVPGIKKEDFKIQLDNDILSISSELKQDEHQKEGERYTLREFSYQSFVRTFTLSDIADSEKITANYENGILKVNIPKVEEAKPTPPKSIKIS